MSTLSDLVTSVITSWNKAIKASDLNYEIELKLSVRKKKFYIDRNNFFEKHIAELLLLHKATDTQEHDFLLYHEEMIIPPKERHRSQANLEQEYFDILYRAFLYEAVGVFTINCKQLILSQDFAEYDIEKDRLKQHESAKGMIVKAINPGPFYEVGTEFDVFIDDDNALNYAVYTEHEAGVANNGIALVVKTDFMITKNKEASIILLK